MIGVGSRSLPIKNIKILLVWSLSINFYRSYEFEVLNVTKGIKYVENKVDIIEKG